jgi:phosphatidate cytidylyltransferase
MNPKTRNLFVRTASGIVYVALMVAAVFTPWVAVPLALFFITVGLYEFYKLCKNPKLYPVGPIWIAIPLCILFFLWIPKQPVLVLAFLILIWMSDTAAYVFGSLFGKHKLAPNISPGKTWEGFLCSCVFTVGLAVGLSYIPYFQQSGLQMWQWIVLSLIIQVFGLMGDLIESLFKRKAGVKDSGNIIPGHGGVLDRVDSILFATIPVYLFCLMVG